MTTYNPQSQKRKIFCISSYLEKKSFKTALVKFHWNFDFNKNKKQIYLWVQ